MTALLLTTPASFGCALASWEGKIQNTLRWVIFGPPPRGTFQFVFPFLPEFGAPCGARQLSCGGNRAGRAQPVPGPRRGSPRAPGGPSSAPLGRREWRGPCPKLLNRPVTSIQGRSARKLFAQHWQRCSSGGGRIWRLGASRASRAVRQSVGVSLEQGMPAVTRENASPWNLNSGPGRTQKLLLSSLLTNLALPRVWPPSLPAGGSAGRPVGTGLA